MSDYINWITFFRNLISSCISGLLIPYLLWVFIPASQLYLDLTMMMINGGIQYNYYKQYKHYKYIAGGINENNNRNQSKGEGR